MSVFNNTDSSDEYEFLKLIDNINNNGEWVESRNGRVLSHYGNMMRFSLRNNTMPILTTKFTAYKTCLKELLWFISGDTSNKTLQEQKVKIWNGNSTREFLDSRGLTNNEAGDLGPVYGFQWRHFNAPYKTCNDDYSNTGIDQLQYVINMLKDPKERFSRRIIMSAWNPCQIDQMALPPCHVMCQFKVSPNNELSCILYQRSGDVGLGVPFNIASYSYLTHLLAHHCDLVAKEFIHVIGDAHIYEEHLEPLYEVFKNKPYKFPTIQILNKYDSIDQYKFEDFKIHNYMYHNKIDLKMVV